MTMKSLAAAKGQQLADCSPVEIEASLRRAPGLSHQAASHYVLDEGLMGLSATLRRLRAFSGKPCGDKTDSIRLNCMAISRLARTFS